MRHSLRTPMIIGLAGDTAPLEAEIRYLLDDANSAQPVMSIISTSVIADGEPVPAPWLEPIVLQSTAIRSEMIEHALARKAA